jgi:hypothetical protein
MLFIGYSDLATLIFSDRFFNLNPKKLQVFYRCDDMNFLFGNVCNCFEGVKDHFPTGF